MNDVIVIGCGAAGMMAAYAAACQKKQVVILEKNEKAGKKLFITGKGRCNVTNACEIEGLFESVMSNPRFLYSAFYGFDNHAVMEFFERAGCALKTERGERVFPVSDHSSDVIAALLRELKKQGVRIRYECEVKEVLTQQDRVKGVRLKNGEILNAKKVVVATGGISYAGTGSTGDGYRFAKKAGHTVTPLYPSLVPFTVEEEWCMQLSGLSLKNVEVVLMEEKKECFRGFGEMLFTHFGISGPLILSASSCYVKQMYGKKARLLIDLKPALSIEQLDRRLLRDFEEGKNRQFKNMLSGLFPSRLIPVMIRLSEIEPEKKVHDITKAQRQHFVQVIKALPLTITGTRDYQEAIITKGGVSVREVNPSTMESKIISGLYFAGEVLDVDAVTGGFNLQIAWSTGYLAGKS